MGINMKTTLDVSDALFYSAKEFAKESQTTLRALVEEGLRRVLGDKKTMASQAFQLKDARVGLGGEELISDSRLWAKMHEDHVLERHARVEADMTALLLARESIQQKQPKP
jgi:hypothetical protein